MWEQSEFDNIFEMLKKIQEDVSPEMQLMFDKEKKEHPEFSDEDIWKIVNDHLKVDVKRVNPESFNLSSVSFGKDMPHKVDGNVETNEAEKTAPPVPQTMKPQEEPVINAEDHSMEDLSKEDKEKKDKEKEKVAKETGTKDMQKIEDKDLEQKQPKKESRQQLHLCNKCFKTFRSNESICTHCKSNEVEKIVVEKKEEKKNSTIESRVQESTYNVIFGDKHIETVKDAVSKADAMSKAKVAYPVSRFNNKPIAITSVFKLEGEAIKTGLITYVVTLDDGSSIEVQAKSPADVLDIIKAKNLKKNVVSTTPVEESKVNETVEELVGESDIDADDQITLRWALEKDVIPKQWPAKEIMFDELAKAGEVGANVATEVDIYANYLKYVLLPRAKEAYSKQAVKEGAIDNVIISVENATLEELENALEVADEMIKQGANKSAWQTIRNILQKGVSDKKKKSESAEVKEGEGSIVGSTKGVYEVKYTDVAGEMRTIKLFAFDEADATISVKKDAKVKEVLSVKKIGEGKVPSESDKEDTKIKKLTEDELEKEKSKFPSPLIDKLKQFAEEHNMTFEELIDIINKAMGIKEQELKLSEQEKDGYTVVAKGLVDKAAADRIATEKKGMAVADADDPKKWQVIVKEA